MDARGMRLNDVLDYLAYLAVRVALCAVQALPLSACQRLAQTLAWLANDVLRLRRRVVEENLRQAFPDRSEDERRDLARRMWEHLLLMVAEIAHAPRKIHDTNWRQYICLPNMPQLMRLLYADTPCVFVSGHYGNFELAAYTFGIFGFETYSVARPLDNRFLDRFVNQWRSSRGQHILPKSGSAAEIAERMSDGCKLTVLADQAAGPKGCFVEFFGRLASTHKAIALFAMANQAPLAVSYARRLDAPLAYEMGIAAVADAQQVQSMGMHDLTQWYTAELEAIIRQAPEQYWWLHRRWKDEPPERRRKTRAA
jgi:KDO2-lipid IV(A) lauroyltransferase